MQIVLILYRMYFNHKHFLHKNHIPLFDLQNPFLNRKQSNSMICWDEEKPDDFQKLKAIGLSVCNM